MNVIVNKQVMIDLVNRCLEDVEHVKTLKDKVVKCFINGSYYGTQSGMVLLSENTFAPTQFGRIYDNYVSDLNYKLDKYKKLYDTNMVESFVIDANELLKINSYNVVEIITGIHSIMVHEYEKYLGYRSTKLETILKVINE